MTPGVRRWANCAACSACCASRARPRRAPAQPQPGIADIDALCARIRAAGPQVVYRTGGELDTLDRGVQLTVYRIVQEALTNALKHAGHDTRVELAVGVKDTRLHIDVHDTGRDGGTVPPGPSQEEGHGLAGMRERAALYNGTVTAGPAPAGMDGAGHPRPHPLAETLAESPAETPAETDVTPPAATGGAV